MPVTMADFDASLKRKGTAKLDKVCATLELTEGQCRYLAENLPSLCQFKPAKQKGARPLTKWQQCIRERRAGKPFDPAAIKQLAKEYRAGTCPSGS